MPATVDFQGERLSVAIDPARLAGEFHGPEGHRGDAIAAEIRRSLEHPMQFPPLRLAVVPGDNVVIAIDPAMPEVRLTLGGVCQVLGDAGVNRAEITVLATQTSAQGWDEILPPGVSGCTHDPDDRNAMAYLATTTAGRRVYLNRKAVDADFLMAMGRFSENRLFGPQGPWTSLFPGLSDTETRQASRSGGGITAQEAAEVGWLVGNQFQLGVVAGTTGIASVTAGLAEAVREEGARRNADAWTFRIPERADLVIAGVGRTEGESGIDDLAASLVAATGLVRRGGKVVILSRIKGEIGPALRRLIDLDEARSAVANLKGTESAPDYREALEIAKALSWANLYLLSGLGEDTAEDLGFIPLNRPEEALNLAKASPSVALLSHAERAQVSIAEDAP